MEPYITFENKLSKSNIYYQTQKMKGQIAAQTLSISVAGALEFLMSGGIPLFIDAAGTIKFIRTIDKIFDILNSRTSFGKGYKQPIRFPNGNYIINSLNGIVEYLFSLRVSSGQKLLDHRRKNFKLGFIVAGRGVIDVSKKLLRRKKNPFNYILTCKFSQDHIRLLFFTARDRNGFNNNRNVQQFKATLKSILLRVSLKSFKQGNCSTFEEGPHNTLFMLKWTKTSLIPPNEETNFPELLDFPDLVHLLKKV